MINKIPYVIKPYRVGTKNGKSLAMIIPAGFARDNQIDTSTIFILKNELNNLESITLQRIRYSEDEKTVIPIGEGLEASTRRVPSRSQ
jgi:hypothetical protein